MDQYLLYDQNIIISFFDINECEIELSKLDINDHNNFVISSKMSIINIFNISTNNVSLLYLNNSRNINEISANINIYNSIFINDNDLFEIYLKPNDFISLNTSNFIQSTRK